MPVQVSYPGVYIEELPSGQHTIVGVATSITAFVGRAVSGPPDEAITIFSFGDYERLFGGLRYGYPLSYAVRDFFLNGGSQAVIVRLIHTPTPAKPDTPAPPTATAAALLAPAKKADAGTPDAQPPVGPGTSALPLLVAATPGMWGDSLTAKVDHSNITQDVVDRFKRYNINDIKDLFNLTVTYTQPDGQTLVERFTNVTIKGTNAPNRLDRVLVQKSDLVVVNPSLTKDLTQLTQYTLPDDEIELKGSSGTDSENLDAKDYQGSKNAKTGIYALDNVDLFNLLCIPPDANDGDLDVAVYQDAAKYCYDRRAVLIIDSPTTWTDKFKTGEIGEIDLSKTFNIGNPDARNAAVYFPRVIKEDLDMNGQLDTFPACGIIAGAIASTDVQRGVWKAPAGRDTALQGIAGLEVKLSDAENGTLNQLGINCLRSFPIIGPVVWGARTLRGADQLGDDYKYLSVRRLTLYIEESLYRGTNWAVFEPNDETLWSSLRLSVGTFMADLSRQGAFYNYKVVCDKTTTTQSDIDKGIVNVLVLFAPVKPAEFVVIQIQQQAGQNTP